MVPNNSKQTDDTDAGKKKISSTNTQHSDNKLKDDPRFQIRPMQQVASACTGGIITAIFMIPLDVIKTRIQAQQTQMSNKCFLYCNGLMDHLCRCDPKFPATKHVKLNGTIDALIKISRSEGITSLWSGLSPTLVSALPSTIIYFVAYEQFKERFLKFHYTYLAESKGSHRGRDIPPLIPLLSGVTARVSAVTFVSPVELIRTKMQSEKMTYAQIFSATRNVVQTQGILGLWRGLPPTILRDVPFSGIYWTCYETIKSRFSVVEPTFSFSFMAGAISGSLFILYLVKRFIAVTILNGAVSNLQILKRSDLYTNYDINLCKNNEYSAPTNIKGAASLRIAINCASWSYKPAKNVPYNGVAKRLKSIYAVNGIRGVFAGLGPRLFKVAPACAIMISTFEYSKSFYYQHNIHKYNENLILTSKNNV